MLQRGNLISKDIGPRFRNPTDQSPTSGQLQATNFKCFSYNGYYYRLSEEKFMQQKLIIRNNKNSKKSNSRKKPK